MRKAIIGGTGVYSLTAGFPGAVTVSQSVMTAYGTVDVEILKTPQGEVVFLARHGKEHAVPPHLINYRANMMALSILEVDEILATCAVGSMRRQFDVGDVVLLRDFLDFTKGRIQTFYDGGDGMVRHVAMGSPYCPRLSAELSAAAQTGGLEIKGEGVYVCTEGPRFETAAEIRMFSQLGGDVVGMTNVPECVLAKELGMCYAAVGIVSNWCTGIRFDDVPKPAGDMVKPAADMDIHDIEAAMAKNKEAVTQLFLEILIKNRYKAVEKAGHEAGNPAACNCGHSVIII